MVRLTLRAIDGDDPGGHEMRLPTGLAASSLQTASAFPPVAALEVPVARHDVASPWLLRPVVAFAPDMPPAGAIIGA
jgi:hypothetical protein